MTHEIPGILFLDSQSAVQRMFLLERASQFTSPCWAGSRASHQRHLKDSVCVERTCNFLHGYLECVTISGGSFACTLKMKDFHAKQAAVGSRYGSRGGVGDGLVASEEELTGGIGGATPAVCEPRPSFCRVFASSLPEAFSPCTA